jgi:phage terminase large subunit-like protein
VTPRNKAANRAVEFINGLSCTGDFDGQPFKLRPWQESYVRRLFGTLHKDGRRVYRSSFLYCPRRQGKSSLIAAICVMLLFTGGPGQQILLCASDRNQASHIWKMMASMIRNEPYLLRLIGGEQNLVPSTKRIAYPAKNSFVEALSSDAPSKRGYNPSTLVFDEIVAFKSRDLWDVLTSGTSSRAEPLTIALSTAGDSRQSLIWDRLQYAKKVAADPSVDPTHLPVLFYAEDDEPWDDEATWRKCNPALDGGYQNIEDLRIRCREAKELPYLERVFRREVLNQFVDCSDHVWIRASDWAACTATEEPDLSSRPTMAVDLSSVVDLTGVSFCWGLGDDRYHVKSYAWMPHDSMLEAEIRDKQTYRLWHDQQRTDGNGPWLRTCPGNSIDYRWLLDDLVDLIRDYQPSQILWDSWGARYLIQQLEPLGIPMFEFRQGPRSMSQPTKEMERLVLQRRLTHDGSPVSAMCVANVQLDVGSMESVAPSKRRSNGRIDLAISSIMSLEGAMSQSGTSIYETRGLFV